MNSIQYILITGASTGIGRACAGHLVQKGFHVFAGVRHADDLEALKKAYPSHMIPVMLDVTSEESIRAAFQLIKGKTGGSLFGLINNAGVGTVGVIEAAPADEVRKIFDVNVIGLVAVTRAFLPLLRKQSGRIINIGSSSSYFAGPGLGIYAGSKFAVRAITDSLRHELSLFNMQVALIAPGPVASEIWEKSRKVRDRIRDESNDELKVAYAPFIRLSEKVQDHITLLPALEVARAVEHALTSKNARHVYAIGKNAKRARLLSYLPSKWIHQMIARKIKAYQ